MPRHRVSTFHRLLLIFVIHVVNRPKRVLLISLLGVAAAAALAMGRLNVSTDQDKLFSSNVPFFRDYLSFVSDFPENQANYVIVQPRDPSHPPPVARWVALADAITARLAAQKDSVQEVDSHVPLESLGGQGILFEDHSLLQQDLSDTQQLIPLARLWGERPSGMQTLLGRSPLERFISGLGLQNADAQSAQFATLLANGWSQAIKQPNTPLQIGQQVPDLSRLGASDPSRLGYYYVPDQQNPAQHLLLVRVYEKKRFSSLHGLEGAINSIRAAMNEAARPFPEFQVGLTGRPALEADEMTTTDTDSRRAEVLALSAVFIGLVLLLRSIWLAITAEIALLIAIGWTFGWATVATAAYTHSTFGELNLLSAVFLIALIGIGMDYLIQVLTRYRREASRHDGQAARKPRVIWIGVFKYVAAPINTACCGAAGAFLVSVFTHFRGAAELGIIASGGLLLCLSTGYIILPALLTLFPPRVKPWRQTPVITEYPPTHHYHTWLIAPVCWAALLLGGIPFALRARFDPGLINMQAPNLPSVQLVNKLQMWSDVELSKDVDVLRRVRVAVRQLPAVGSTESILDAYDNYDWLHAHQGELPSIAWTPPTPIEPDELPALTSKARALARKYLRAAGSAAGSQSAQFTAAANALNFFAVCLPADIHTPDGLIQAMPIAKRLSQWQNAFVDQLKNILNQFRPQPPNVNTMPPALREHLIGQDGRFALYVYPRKDLWAQANLKEFVTQLEPAVAGVPGAMPITGIASDLYHSTSSIHAAFFHATVYALALIVLLVLLDLRNVRQTLLAVSVLAMGLPVLVALMGLLHIHWNFANFFGLPILIGAGHEYGVFMVHRYNEACRDSRRAWHKWDVSDRALLACAYVTTASFGFFGLLAHHRGLRSLGIVMALGTACIYLATLCMLRPLLLWHLSRQAARRHAGLAAQCMSPAA